MKIMISGISPELRDQVDAEIRAALALHPDAGDLVVLVTRLPTGSWLTHVFDGQTGAEVTELRVLARRLGAVGKS